MTPRMREAFLLLCEGLTNKEIGVLMCLEVQSVKSILQRVYDVLGVHNRREAILHHARYPFPDTTAQRKGESAHSGSVG